MIETLGIDTLAVARWLHVIGATILLGTGAGIAFFMVMAHRTRNPVIIAHTAAIVVIADFIFTATAVIAQPLTGLWLANLVGWSLMTPWLIASTILYGVVGLFWLPVVAIQIRIRDIARRASTEHAPLPRLYFRLYRIWFAFGFPAFFAVLAILWLMLAKPAL